MAKKEFIKGIPINDIITKYRELGNVWKVGATFGISGQTIHTELKKLGVVKPMNYFSDADKQTLLSEFTYYRDRAELNVLANKLGRTVPFLCRKAKELGLTKYPKHFKLSDEKRSQQSKKAKERIKTYGHPKGMLGKSHSDETKKILSESSKKMWKENTEYLHSPKMRRIRSDNMSKLQLSGKFTPHSRCKMFDVSIGGKSFLVKSVWEYDIALYFEYLKSHGYISDWNYEPKVFEFKYNTLGVRTYKPDFSVIKNDREYYIEVKGWQDDKFKIKKGLMEKEYPDVKMLYICERQYLAIYKKHYNDIPEYKTVSDKVNPRVEFRLITIENE